MNEVAPVSVVVVSQNRPEYLYNCLNALRDQTYQNFELIVIADALPQKFQDIVKFHVFGESNIAAARNIGLTHAAAKIVAFCDDDAIPHHTWLERLVAPLIGDEAVGSTTGFTLGRNGISQQWGAARFDVYGNDQQISLPNADNPTIFEASQTKPVKLLGTNMAFRREALASIGGFDENYHYYLDETDVKIRLDKNGWKTAIIPHAQVQHLSAPSRQRSQNRELKEIFDIAKSKAYFCHQHADEAKEGALEDFSSYLLTKSEANAHQERRAEIARAYQSAATLSPIFWNDKQTHTTFQKYPVKQQPHIVIAASFLSKKWAKSITSELIDNGVKVTKIVLNPTPHYHQSQYLDGHWQITGGVFGKSERTQPLFRVISWHARILAEVKRIHAQNPVNLVVFKRAGKFVHKNSCLLPLKQHKVMEYSHY